MNVRVGSLVSVLVLLSGCGGRPDEDVAEEPTTQVRSAITSQEMALAFAWAPIHYMDISPDGNHSLGGSADFVVAVNYDGDFNGRNNWDNLGAGYPLYGQAYTAVSESSSHYFIYYTFYHPRDWTNNTFPTQEHENDMEGMMMLVRKDGSQFGKLEAVITTADEWQTYKASPNLGRGTQNPNTPATIATESWGLRSHPMTYQIYEGHGITGCTSTSCGVGSGNDVVKYQPHDPSQPLQAPPIPVPKTAPTAVGYRLLDLGTLFARRYDNPTFATPSALIGDTSGGCGEDSSISCDDNQASAIWAFEHSYSGHDGDRGTGEDPAAVFRALFSFSGGLTPPTSDYITNKFLHQKCDLPPAGQQTIRRMMGSGDPCVQQICGTDPFCCNTGWDGVCVNEVNTICGKTCSNCNANICQTQSGPIGTGCDGQCAASICAVDSYCCNNAWDSFCVGEVASVCGLNCNGP